jgi:hypothetical protein
MAVSLKIPVGPRSLVAADVSFEMGNVSIAPPAISNAVQFMSMPAISNASVLPTPIWRQARHRKICIFLVMTTLMMGNYAFVSNYRSICKRLIKIKSIRVSNTLMGKVQIPTMTNSL